MYAVFVVKAPIEQHADLYHSIKSSLESEALPDFVAAAPSLEDTETVILYSGWRSESMAQYFLTKLRDRTYRDFVSIMMRQMLSGQSMNKYGEMAHYLAK